MPVTEDRVRQILHTVTVDGAQLRIAEPLERAEYVAVNRVLENLGGRWNRTQQAHVFPADTDAAALVADVCRGGELPKPVPQEDRDEPARTSEDYVATPRPLADDIVREFTDLDQPHVHRVLEPSAGDGVLVHAMLAARSATNPGLDRGLQVTAVEPNAARTAALPHTARVAVHTTTIEAFAAAHDPAQASDGGEGCDTGDGFDAVLANPPFALPGQPTAWIDHLYTAWRLLRPGARLTFIAPCGYVFREDIRHRQLREFIARHGGGHVELPDDAFGRSGIRTVVVWADKPTDPHPEPEPPPKRRCGKPSDAERAERRAADRELRHNADELLDDAEQTAALRGYLDTPAVSDRVRSYSPRNQALLYTQATARACR